MQTQYSTDILSVSPRIADNGYTWAEAMLVCSQRRAGLPNPRGDVARDIAIRLVPVIMKINGFTGPLNFWSGSCNSAGTSCGAWSFTASNSGMFMKNLPVTTTTGFTYLLCQAGEFGLCSICSQVSYFLPHSSIHQVNFLPGVGSNSISGYIAVIHSHFSRYWTAVATRRTLIWDKTCITVAILYSPVELSNLNN